MVRKIQYKLIFCALRTTKIFEVLRSMKKFGEPLLYAILFYILTQSVDGKRGRQVLILAIAHFFSFIRFLFKQSEGKKIIRHVKKMSKFCR